jgi:hypothetical protein
MAEETLKNKLGGPGEVADVRRGREFVNAEVNGRGRMDMVMREKTRFE